MMQDKRTRHYRRPDDASFTADQRAEVTILLGGLTWRHERLVRAVLQNSGHRCECLPLPDREAHEIGKEYCGNNLCNPVYFTVGSLIQYLRGLERSGLTRDEIVRHYLFFTAGSGGPCRYGMYEAEFRAALAEAGFSGFRVMLFVQEHGVKASTGQSGLEFSADFNAGVFLAFVLGDLLSDIHRKLRAYETSPGHADAVVKQVVIHLENYFRAARHFDLAESAPPLLRGILRRHRNAAAFRWTNTTLKILDQLYGDGMKEELRQCRKIISRMPVNRLQVKPVVKVIGEFWAQLTEGDGNFRMFEFLEQEGAEVAIEPISTWVMYLLHQAVQRLVVARRLITYEEPWTHPLRALERSAEHSRFQRACGCRPYRFHGASASR
jgi:predicted nucleotide-binding protein (sugar kinase/HSP70/actin superfamily)